MIVLTFTASALLLFLDDERPVARVLFFGNTDGRGLSGEVRYLPRRAEHRDQLRLLVDELILGSQSREYFDPLHISTEVRSLMLNGDTLYLDLSATALLADPDHGMQGTQRLHAIASTLKFNFRWIRRLYLFVDSQEPNYEPPRRGWGRPCC